MSFSISATSREPRKNEKDGEDYNFISIEKFESLIKNGKFAEWENVHGNYYGTLKSYLDSAIDEKRIVLLELDVNGTASIQNLYPNNSHSIFIVPPNIKALRKRLKHRGSESTYNIEKRLKRFKKEMAFKDRFDTLLINDNIEVAKNEFLKKLNEIIEGA